MLIILFNLKHNFENSYFYQNLILINFKRLKMSAQERLEQLLIEKERQKLLDQKFEEHMIYMEQQEQELKDEFSLKTTTGLTSINVWSNRMLNFAKSHKMSIITGIYLGIFLSVASNRMKLPCDWCGEFHS